MRSSMLFDTLLKQPDSVRLRVFDGVGESSREGLNKALSGVPAMLVLGLKALFAPLLRGVWGVSTSLLLDLLVLTDTNATMRLFVSLGCTRGVPCV